MAPGILKEESKQKFMALKESFAAAGMFHDIRDHPASQQNLNRTGTRTVDPAEKEQERSSGSSKTDEDGKDRKKKKRRSLLLGTKSEDTVVERTGVASGTGSGSGSRSRSETVVGSGDVGAPEEPQPQTSKPLSTRNHVLDNIANDTMCMAIPLWDFRAEHDERRRARSRATSATPVPDVGPKKTFPPESERQWLLVTYVPFNDTPAPPVSSLDAASTSQGRARASTAANQATSPRGGLFPTSKKRPRKTPATEPSTSPENVRTFEQSLALSFGVPVPASSTPSNSRPNTGSRPKNTSIPPLRSFRIVGRIMSVEELRRSGLRYPGADIPASSEEPIATPAVTSNEEAFTAIIAICHDAAKGHIEYVPEGLDALGFCGNAPQHVIGAVTPFTFEREVGALSSVGKDVVELCWAGALALIR